MKSKRPVNPVPRYQTPIQGPVQAPPTLTQLALQQAQQLTQPQILALQQQQGQQTELYKAMAQAIQGFHAALASQLRGAGQPTSGAYRGAAQDTAAFAKGLSDGEAAAQAANQGETTNFLQGLGANPGEIAAANAKTGGTNAQDVVYGLSGLIPATDLEREGAAFASAQNFMPQYVAGIGSQALMDASRSAATQDRDIANQIAQARAGIPALALQRLDQLNAQRQSDRAFNLQKREFGYEKRSNYLDRLQHAKEFKYGVKKDNRTFKYNATQAALDRAATARQQAAVNAENKRHDLASEAATNKSITIQEGYLNNTRQNTTLDNQRAEQAADLAEKKYQQQVQESQQADISYSRDGSIAAGFMVGIDNKTGQLVPITDTKGNLLPLPKGYGLPKASKKSSAKNKLRGNLSSWAQDNLVGDKAEPNPAYDPKFPSAMKRAGIEPTITHPGAPLYGWREAFDRLLATIPPGARRSPRAIRLVRDTLVSYGYKPPAGWSLKNPYGTQAQDDAAGRAFTQNIFAPGKLGL